MAHAVRRQPRSNWGTLPARRRWPLQEAKNKLSNLVDRALDGEPQCISRHGKDVAVIISYAQFAEATKPRRSAAEFFRSSPLVGYDLDIVRSKDPARKVEL